MHAWKTEAACSVHLLRNKLHHASGKPQIGVLALAQRALDAYHKLCSQPVKAGAFLLADHLQSLIFR